MQSVLDKFIQASTFRPGSPGELFALRIAQKLGDPKAAKAYVMLTEHHTEAQMLRAYKQALRKGGGGDRWKLFRAELQSGRETNGSYGHSARLLAIRVERRTIAAAVFSGTHLEYTDSRQLSSSRDKAIISAIRFVNWILDSFDIESGALETIVNGNEIHRRKLQDAISGQLREHGLPIWEIPKAAIFDGFGYPPLVSRTELRDVIESIWPAHSRKHANLFVQDAAALGLHVQIERQFMS